MNEAAFFTSADCKTFGQSIPPPAIFTRPSVRWGSNARSSISTAAPVRRFEISASIAASCAAPLMTPSHSARGWRLLGNVPMPRHCTSNGAMAIGSASSGLIRSTSSGSTSPRNRIVTWSAAGLTQTTFGGVFAASSFICSALTTRAASRRTASPMSTATNTRMLTLGQVPAQHVNGPVRRHPLHNVAPTGESKRPHGGASFAVDGNAHGADRFLLGAAARTGDTSDTHTDVDLSALPNADGHRVRDGFADRAVLLDQRLWHIEQFDLRTVAVRHDAALEVLGAAGNVSEPRSGEPSGARFSERDPPAARLQQLAHYGLEALAISADNILAEGSGQLG